MRTDDLFSPAMVGSIPVANRVVMAPMTRARADSDGVQTPLAAEYYRQRSSAGLIITESAHISQQGCGSAFSPGIHSDAQVDAWRRVTAAVHGAGGRILLQLWHAGRFSHVSLQKGGDAPVAPSAIQADGEVLTENGDARPSRPRALTLFEIDQIIDDYRVAAKNAVAAGFDGVEIHAASNYLLELFIRDSTNHRVDRYGGCVDNRIRLTIEVAEAVATVVGADRVGVRLSPISHATGGTPLDSNPQATYGALVARLAQLNLAFLHCYEGRTRDANRASGFDFQLLRNSFGGRYISNGGYDFALATQAIAERKADLISFGRHFIANPDLVERFRRGAPLVRATKDVYYGGGERGYTDWKSMDV
jgi:N-ethylmaleimide reductase